MRHRLEAHGLIARIVSPFLNAALLFYRVTDRFI